MSDVQAASKLREKYEHFRILVIGRANAGKTTLLKRVCNTNEDPCIYDGRRENLLEPNPGRGIHDINRPFVFRSNPQYIFHDSPGFEAGDESQLKKVQDFIKDRAKAKDVNEQLHVIWFCFSPNKSRFLLDVEEKFFNEQRWGNVPVIAVFTKFDDFIVQVYDTNLDYQTNRKNAEKSLEELQIPLFRYKFPPRAGVRLEDMQNDDGDHQEQVKVLIDKTTESLDDIALKMLFVSVQQGNLELCIEYAVKYTRVFDQQLTLKELVQDSVLWFRHAYFPDYDYEKKEDEELRKHGGLVHNLLLREQNGLNELTLEKKLARKGLLKRGLRYRYFYYINEITKVMEAKMESQSVGLVDFIALILCLEKSFWLKSPITLFIEDFAQAHQLYITTGTKKRVESNVEQLGVPSGRKEFRVALINILLEHRMSDQSASNSSQLLRGRSFGQKVRGVLRRMTR